jgi:hypothetical protein
MFEFLYFDLYSKFQENAEIRELIVDAIISVTSSEKHIAIVKGWIVEGTFTFSPEQKYRVLSRIFSSSEI